MVLTPLTILEFEYFNYIVAVIGIDSYQWFPLKPAIWPFDRLLFCQLYLLHRKFQHDKNKT
jgi:hypothetical protein